MISRHPKRRQLKAWLDGEAPELDEHLDSCDRCSRTLEELSGADADLRPALLSLLAPPDDLEQRIQERIAARMQDRRDISLFSSLLGVGIETGRVVLGPTERS